MVTVNVTRVIFFQDFGSAVGYDDQIVANSWRYNQHSIGEILRRARTLIGISIRDLAARSGVSTSQILRVESGEFDIMLSTLLKLARHLGIPAGLVLEQGALPNPGFYAKLIGSTGIAGLLSEIPAEDRPRDVRTRIVMLCTQAAVGLASLLQSSNPVKLASLIDFPCQAIADAFTMFAANIDTLDVEDRVSLQRELDENPVELLARLKLVTPLIAIEFLRQFKGHPDFQPNWNKIL